MNCCAWFRCFSAALNIICKEDACLELPLQSHSVHCPWEARTSHITLLPLTVLWFQYYGKTPDLSLFRHSFCMEVSVQRAAFWLVFHHKSYRRRAAISKTFTRKPQGFFARLQWVCLEHGIWRLSCLTLININRVRRLNACAPFWWRTRSIWQVACCHL